MIAANASRDKCLPRRKLKGLAPLFNGGASCCLKAEENTGFESKKMTSFEWMQHTQHALLILPSLS
jgi:hypothetical protein